MSPPKNPPRAPSSPLKPPQGAFPQPDQHGGMPPARFTTRDPILGPLPPPTSLPPPLSGGSEDNRCTKESRDLVRKSLGKPRDNQGDHRGQKADPEGYRAAVQLVSSLFIPTVPGAWCTSTVQTQPEEAKPTSDLEQM